MDIALVLRKIRPNSRWTMVENSYQKLRWLDASEKPTLKEIKAAWPEIEQEELENQKRSLRQLAYQKESDPLFFKYQRGEATKEEWLEKIKEIKKRYPSTAISQE
jgi:hypothetical protein